ncbi:unnamed protein product, partial [Rotaria sp. Silwood2]
MTSSPDKDLSSFSDISLHSSLLPISSTAAGCTRSLSAVEAIAAKYLALKQATIAKIIKHLIRRPYGVSVTNIGFSTTTTTAQNEVNPAPLDVNLSNYETVFSYKWLYETLDKSRIEKSTTSNYKTSSIRKTMTSSPDKDLSSFSDISLHSSLLPISSTAAGN